jgi:Lysozyme like domain
MPKNTSEIDWGPESLRLNREQIAQVAYNAGFRGQDLVNMVGIAMRESGGHAGLYVNRPRTGDWSYGLWGLNIGKNRSYWPSFQKWGITDPSELRTPEGNARAAYAMFKERGLYPWGGYKGKSGTYSTDLKAAAAAVKSAAAKGMLGKSTSYGSYGGGWQGEAGSLASPYSNVGTRSMSAPAFAFYNWVSAGWNAASKYRGKGTSPYLSGMLGWLQQNYGGSDLGGYNYRPAKGAKSLPSAHASGAAVDWGYGGNRSAADRVIDMFTSDPNRYGIQLINDYSGMRSWRVGQGWKQERRGSGGGDMKPGSTWLHLEVTPSRYGAQWNPDSPTSMTSTDTGAPTESALRRLLAMNFLTASTPTPRRSVPSLTTSVAPQTAGSSISPGAPNSSDIQFYAGSVPTGSQDLARMVAQRRLR